MGRGSQKSKGLGRELESSTGSSWHPLGTGGFAAPSVLAPRLRCWHLMGGWAGDVTQEPGVLPGPLSMNP